MVRGEVRGVHGRGVSGHSGGPCSSSSRLNSDGAKVGIAS